VTQLPRRRIFTTLATLGAVSLFAIASSGCMAAAPAGPPGDCATALAYLAAHEAPGFVAYCQHSAGGNAAETVVPPQQVSPSGRVTGFIYINDTNCVVAYENEAANSHGHLVLDSNGDGNYQWVWPTPFDPYGQCPA
jgi:hypothetical protein